MSDIKARLDRVEAELNPTEPLLISSLDFPSDEAFRAAVAEAERLPNKLVVALEYVDVGRPARLHWDDDDEP